MAAKKKKTKKKVDPNWRELLNRSAEKLDAPPGKDWIVRPEPVGALVAEFAVPSRLCPTTNQTRHLPGYMMANMKKALWRIMSEQCEPFASPLPGRPQVICVRFGKNEVDPYSDWAKFPIDMLCCEGGRANKHRLGILSEDRGSAANISQHWEPGPASGGWCYIAIFTGS